jgi:hypothetical protein
MSSQYISSALRQRVAESFRFRCAYCHTSQRVVGPFLEIDHILPEAHGGTADEENLCLACPMCNSHKADKYEALDPESGQLVPLFSPRQDKWQKHFEWVEEAAVIQGKTPIERATVEVLQMNHPDVVAVRRLWVMAGWHPPKD